MKWLGFLALALVATTHAELRTETVEYRDGDVTLKGFLAYDDSATGPQPGILVVHEWWGLNDYAKQRAQQLAALGYVALAVDMYGDGFQTTSVEEAARRSGPFKEDRPAGRRRIRAALEVLRSRPQVNPRQIAAIGYCFGGTTVLELARSGADVAGVVSFHGSLGTSLPAQAGEIKAAVLVCHGADDTFVTADELAQFQQEMRGLADDLLRRRGSQFHQPAGRSRGDSRRGL
jgi:dienelactone hydrolase